MPKKEEVKKTSKSKVLKKKPIETKENVIKNVIGEEEMVFDTNFIPTEIKIDEIEPQRPNFDENNKIRKHAEKILIPRKGKYLKIENGILTDIDIEKIKDDEYIIKGFDNDGQLYNICYRDNKTIKPFVRDLLENMNVETALTKRVRTILLFTIFNFIILFIVGYYSLINGNIIKKIPSLQNSQSIPDERKYIGGSINTITESEVIKKQVIQNSTGNILNQYKSGSINNEQDKKRAEELREKMNNYYKRNENNSQTGIIDNL